MSPDYTEVNCFVYAISRTLKIQPFCGFERVACGEDFGMARASTALHHYVGDVESTAHRASPRIERCSCGLERGLTLR